MNSRKIFLTVAFLGGVLSSASATAFTAPALVAPAPARLATPAGLSRSHLDATATLRLNADTVTSQPRTLQALPNRHEVLARHPAAAISLRQFTPARQAGVPVPAKVEQPAESVEL